jgi:uncharacterized protein (DUF1697 family)
MSEAKEPRRRYVAFLRGVSPMNAKMIELKHAFEDAGFSEVKTVLSSGNVAFTARAKSALQLAGEAEAAMARLLDRVFRTIVRPSSMLRDLIKERIPAPHSLCPRTQSESSRFYANPADPI